MGRLVLFRRRIAIADDDLYAPAIHSLVLHSIWLASVGVVYSLINDTCLVPDDFYIYILCHLAFLCAIIPLELVIIATSLSGSISKGKFRIYISFMFHIHIILTLFEFGIQSFGLFVLYGTNPLSQSIICLSSYSEHKILFAYITIIWGFVGSIFWMIVIFIVVYNSMTSKTQNITKYNHIWQKRLEWFGIHKKLTNGTDVLTDVAETFADYLHDVDWAPSDYLVGLLLLKREHKQNRDSIQERRRQDFVNQKRIIQNLANDSTILGSSIIHSTTTERPIDAFLAPLWESIKNYTPFNQNTPTNNGRMENNDSTFHQNKASFNTKYGFEVMTRDDIADILYFARYAEAVYSHENSKTLCGDKLLLFSNDNDLFKSPYLIARDDEWKVIVISIRGTYSAADWLVDLTIESVMIPIPELGDDKIHLTHGGILRTAKNILRQLQENDTLSNIMKDPSTLGYDIIVAGHSLGAGAASLLTYMLRLDGYVNARCYAYEPPGQMLTEEAAIYFESFTISVVSGDDMICRLTRNSMQILKLEMTRLLSECQEPKYKVIGSALNSYCCGGKRNKKRPRIPTTLMMSPDRKSCILNVTDSDSTKERRRKAEKEKHRLSWVLKPFSPILQNEIQARVEKVKNLVKSMDPTHVKEEVLEEVSLLPSLPMYIPGKILYIEKCRLWNDDVDIDLPWTTSRFSMLSFDSDKSTPVKERSPMDSKAIEMNEKERKFKYAYTPRWASREEFQEIIVSRSILSDHFPFQMMKDLEAIEVGRKLRIPKYK